VKRASSPETACPASSGTHPPSWFAIFDVIAIIIALIIAIIIAIIIFVIITIITFIVLIIATTAAADKEPGQYRIQPPPRP
jgi:hypothetical protein